MQDTHICVYVYIYIHIRIHTHIYIYTHIYIQHQQKDLFFDTDRLSRIISGKPSTEAHLRHGLRAVVAGELRAEAHLPGDLS